MTPRRCDRTDCTREATRRPVVVFVRDDGVPSRAVVGIAICEPCAATLKRADQVLKIEEIEKIADSLAAASGPGRRIPFRRLEWIPLTSRESRLFEEMTRPPS